MMRRVCVIVSVIIAVALLVYPLWPVCAQTRPDDCDCGRKPVKKFIPEISAQESNMICQAFGYVEDKCSALMELRILNRLRPMGCGAAKKEVSKILGSERAQELCKQGCRLCKTETDPDCTDYGVPSCRDVVEQDSEWLDLCIKEILSLSAPNNPIDSDQAKKACQEYLDGTGHQVPGLKNKQFPEWIKVCSLSQIATGYVYCKNDAAFDFSTGD